jgi:uncharacterized protein (DUF1778 family)
VNEQERFIRLSAEETVAFLAALNAPFQPNERLKKAMEDAARLAQR